MAHKTPTDTEILLTLRNRYAEARKVCFAETTSEKARREAMDVMAVTITEMHHPRMVAAAEALSVGGEA